MKGKIIVFIVAFIGISLFYNYPEILLKKNGSIHQWRQADCLSITQNYYKENLPFHTPKIHHISDETGKRGVASEFPIVYYLIGNIWKITGQKEWIFRLVNVLIAFIGMFYLFKLFSQIFSQIVPSLFLAFFLFTSPIYVYYTNNFVADTTALNIVFIGWYHFYQFYKTRKNISLLWMLSLFTLAGLIKISSLFSFFALGGILVLELAGILRNKETKLFKPIHLLYFFFPLVIIGAWYSYAISYSQANGNSYVFLKGILPIWDISLQRINDTFSAIYSVQLPRIFNLAIHLSTLLIFVWNMIHFRKINTYVAALNGILFIGVSLFFILFFQVFDIHDYYFINSLIFYLFTWFTFFVYLKENTRFFSNKSSSVMIAMGLLFLIFVAGVHVRHRYNTKDSIAYAGYDYISQHDKDVLGWYQFDYGKNQQAYEDITPYLRSLGIVRDDIVIVIDDLSINISLYNMDQLGLTHYCNATGFDNKIELAKSLGAKYLFISEYKKEDYKQYAPYMTKEFGKFKNILIYSLLE